MKNIKLFENFDINEAGEWSKDMDWAKVKSMSPDEIEGDEQASWILRLENKLMSMKDAGVNLEITDIVGFDMYQGPYAIVEFKGKPGAWNVWTAEHDQLFIEDWVDGNTDRGFVGTEEEIVNILK